MPGGRPPGGMIAPDPGVIRKARHRRNQRANEAKRHAVKGSRDQFRRAAEDQAGQIQHEAEKEKSNREMHQEGMERVMERLAFEQSFHRLFLRGNVRSGSLGDFSPFAFREPGDVDAVSVNHSPTQIGRDKQHERARD